MNNERTHTNTSIDDNALPTFLAEINQQIARRYDSDSDEDRNIAYGMEIVYEELLVLLRGDNATI